MRYGATYIVEDPGRKQSAVFLPEALDCHLVSHPVIICPDTLLTPQEQSLGTWPPGRRSGGRGGYPPMSFRGKNVNTEGEKEKKT